MGENSAVPADCLLCAVSCVNVGQLLNFPVILVGLFYA